jgi:hypothetical protein
MVSNLDLFFKQNFKILDVLLVYIMQSRYSMHCILLYPLAPNVCCSHHAEWHPKC